MPSVSTFDQTGNILIDGLLAGIRWGTNSLTFSFPTSASYFGTNYGSGEPLNNFGALNPAQQDIVRLTLAGYASIINVTFSELSESSTRHGDLRFALSDTPGTAWAYLPSSSSEGGDTWFHRTDKTYDQPIRGNYAYSTFIHEVGHALGLKHPHEDSGGFGALPESTDVLEFTLMSYRSYAGGMIGTGYTNQLWDYPQTLMVADIRALQHMYGANFNTNSGNTVYQWSPSSGEMFVNGVGQGRPGANKIFQTVWDGGGTDTYDFSNYNTAVRVDLRPGAWTVTARDQIAHLHYDGSKLATGNVANALLHNGDTRSLVENAMGSGAADTIKGNSADNSLWGKGGNDEVYGLAGNDTLTGGAGDDRLDGGTGHDTAVFSGAWTNYNLSKQAALWTVVDLRVGSPDGTDTLLDIEYLQLLDSTVLLAELTGEPNTTFSTDSILIDGIFYLAFYRDVFFSKLDPDTHYAEFGWREGRDPNAYFSTVGYLAANGDVKAAGINPLEHYHQSGWREGRDPSAWFDTTLYLQAYADVKAAGLNPLEHYLTSGQAEGRQIFAAVGRTIQTGFDAEFYYLANPDVARAGVDAFTHFQVSGWREGRDPNAYFDASAYLSVYTDVAAAEINPLEHYMLSGWREGRDPSGAFDTSSYLSAYTDIAAANINPLQHFLQTGIYEGRSSFADGAIG